MLIASILAWLSIPKTMHIQTALTQLIMPLLMWSMLTRTLRASPEMKDILRFGGLASVAGSLSFKSSTHAV